MTTAKKLMAGLAVFAVSLGLGAGALRAQQNDQEDNDLRNLKSAQDSLQAATFLAQADRRAWLGVELNDVSAEKARELKLGGEYGALVTRVEEDSPAAKAGVEKGDVITEFDHEKVRSMKELTRLVGETPPGRTVEIRLRRNGEQKTLNATLQASRGGFGPLISRLGNQEWPAIGMPEIQVPEIHVPEIDVPAYSFSLRPEGARLGVSVDELTPQLAGYFGVKQGKGVLVREVSPGSAAEKAGLKAGDCIVQAEGTPVSSVEDLHRALRDKGKPGESREVTLTIVRDRQEQTVKVQLEGPPRPDRHAMAEGGGAGRGSPELNQLVAELRALAPNAEAEALAVRQLRSELESQRGALTGEVEELRREIQSEKSPLNAQAEARTQAAQAARQAQQLRQQLLKNYKDELKQQMQQLRPEIERLHQELRELEREARSPVA
jgi:serine protease Do